MGDAADGLTVGAADGVADGLAIGVAVGVGVGVTLIVYITSAAASPIVTDALIVPALVRGLSVETIMESLKIVRWKVL